MAETEQAGMSATGPLLPRRRTLAIGLSLAFATATLIGAGLFTYRFAATVPAAHLLAAIAWIGGWALLLWLAALGRADRHWRHGPRAGGVSTLFAVAAVSLAGLTGVFAAGPGSIAFLLHWPAQAGLLVLTALGLRGGLERRAPVTRPADAPAPPFGALRDRLARVIANVWLAAQPPLSAGARLRAALRWWEEELQALGQEPAVAATAAPLSPGLRRLLAIAADDLTEIEAVLAADPPSPGALVEVERRVLAATHRCGRLRRRLHH